MQIEGSVSVRYGQSVPTRFVRIREAGHPVPDLAGVAATQALVELLEETDERDLVICVISGGGSALLTLPGGRHFALRTCSRRQTGCCAAEPRSTR